jgi:hypothetical protein
MSTDLKSLVGRVEIPNTDKKTSEYKEVKVHLTIFHGGAERGKSLQIGYRNENNDYSHLQLSRETCSELRRILHDNF